MKRIMFLALALLGLSSVASAQVTITEIVAFDEYIAALVVSLGPVIGAVVGVFFSLLVVRKGMQWAKRIG